MDKRESQTLPGEARRDDFWDQSYDKEYVGEQGCGGRQVGGTE